MNMNKITATDPEAQSADLVAGNIAQLKALFPELITEGADGAAINVDVLKQLVGDATVSDAEEKYGLNWHGKRRARQLALTPSTGTLRPCPEDSVDWDTTQNLMIEGDNLEVLKLLQKSYAGKVKLIYIDPPYNTGKDFVYPDNFQDSIRNYLELTGQVEGGRKISSNSEASGRLHTDWLNMMYPRLALARQLLADDGVIAMSIDDNEVARLTQIAEDVFGSENIVNVVAIKSSETSGVKMSHVDKKLPKLKEYIVLAAKRRERLTLSPVKISKQGGDTTKLDDYLKYYNKLILNSDDPCKEWRIVDVVGQMKSEGLEISEDSVREYKLANAERVVYRTNNALLAKLTFTTVTEEVTSPTGLKYVWWEGKQMLFLSDYLHEAVCDLWTDVSTINLNKEVCEVEGFGEGQKPIALMCRLMQLITPADSKSIVMDFFAGSGSTAHAVYAQNAADNGDRRFVLIQLPEPLNSEVKEQKVAADFCESLGKMKNIAELTKERVRRADERVKSETGVALNSGFRVYKLDQSNIRAWQPSGNLERDLIDSVEHILPGRDEQDILTELLLKLGLDLCVPIEQRQVAGKTVHAIGGGVLIACLDPRITKQDAEPLALGIADWHQALAPAGDTTCVFRDSAFENDEAKTNLAAILEQHGIHHVRSL